MVSLGTQPVIERAGLVTPHLPVRAPRFYPNKPARPGVSPPEPVASLATITATRSAMHRHASVWAVGVCLENWNIPGFRVLVCLKAMVVAS